MENNSVNIRGKVWYFSNGDFELEAYVHRGNNRATFTVKRATSSENVPDADSINYFRSELSAFASQFLALGFEVAISPEVPVSDLRKKD